jgi:hypothetical protein
MAAVVMMAAAVHAYWGPDGTALCTAAADQFYASMIPDGSGGAVVCWQDNRSGNWNIYAQRVNSLGEPAWTPANGVAICTAPDQQTRPYLVSDGAGGAIIAWMDFRDVPPASPSGASTTLSTVSNVFAQRVNASGAVVWAPNGVALCLAAGQQSLPDPSIYGRAPMVADGSGGALIVWDDRRDGNSDVYAQRVNSSGLVQWGLDGTAICTDPGNQITPTIMLDGIGGVLIAWEDFRGSPGAHSNVYAQRVDTNGSPFWTINGRAVSEATGDQLLPVIVSDGLGGAIVAWVDHRTGDDPASQDIYAQRINANGVTQWVADVAVCDWPNGQWYPMITTDGSFGAIITWQDRRSNSHDDIYAQRVSQAGAVSWVDDGVALCLAPANQASPRIVSDGMGGAIMAWIDHRTSSLGDVYAQRINAAGAVQWPTDGITVCTATGAQELPSIVSDTINGAIVLWEDRRSGNSDIYAQHVTYAGHTGRTEPTITSVVDVPNDQGGFVTVRWKEGSDTAPSYFYEVQRNDFGNWMNRPGFTGDSVS